MGWGLLRYSLGTTLVHAIFLLTSALLKPMGLLFFLSNMCHLPCSHLVLLKVVGTIFSSFSCFPSFLLHHCHLCTPSLCFLSLLYSSISQRGACTHIWYPSFPLRGYPLITLHSWVLQGCNKWRDSSWQATTHRTQHREQSETDPRPFCGRGLTACLRALPFVTGFGFGTHLEATKLLSGNVGQGTLSLHSPSTLLQLTSMS